MLLPSPLLVPTPLTANRASLKPPLQISACGAAIVKDHSGLISFVEIHPKYIANKCCCPSLLRVSPSPSTFYPPHVPTDPTSDPNPKPIPGGGWGAPSTLSRPRQRFKFPPLAFFLPAPIGSGLPAAFPAGVLAGSEYSPTTHSLHVARRRWRQTPCSRPWASCGTCRHAGNSLRWD